jgi:hypothetical protein
VVGRVTTTLAQDIPYFRSPSAALEISVYFYTASPFTIDSVLKGTYDGETVTVLQPTVLRSTGEGNPPFKRSFVGYEEMQPGTTYVLYLTKSDAILGEPKGSDSYDLLSDYFGLYDLNEEPNAQRTGIVSFATRSHFWEEIKQEVQMKYGHLAD